MNTEYDPRPLLYGAGQRIRDEDHTYKRFMHQRATRSRLRTARDLECEIYPRHVDLWPSLVLERLLAYVMCGMCEVYGSQPHHITPTTLLLLLLLCCSVLHYSYSTNCNIDSHTFGHKQPTANNSNSCENVCDSPSGRCSSRAHFTAPPARPHIFVLVERSLSFSLLCLLTVRCIAGNRPIG